MDFDNFFFILQVEDFPLYSVKIISVHLSFLFIRSGLNLNINKIHNICVA